MTGRLLLRIHASGTTIASEVQRTRSSAERSARALRRAGYTLGVEVITAESGPIDAARPVPADALVATCAAGTVLDPRFLPAAARALADGQAATILSHHLLIAAEGAVARRIPDSRRSAFGFASVLEHNPWPGPRVTPAAIDERAGSPDPGWSGVLALLRTGTPLITVPAINVVPDGLGARRDRLDAVGIAQIVAGLQSIAPREAPGPSEWEQRHPFASGSIRIARRGRRGLMRRARDAAGWLGGRYAERRAHRALSATPVPGASDDALSPRRDGEYGRLLADTWDDLSRVADAIIVTAQVSTRSSDGAALDYVRALVAARESAPVVRFLTTADPEDIESGLIPPAAQHLPLPASFGELTAAQRGEFLVELTAVCGARLLAVIDEPRVEDAARRAATTARPAVATQSTSLTTNGAPRDGSVATLFLNGPEQARDAVAAGLAPEHVAVRAFRPLPTLPAFTSVTQYTAAHDDVEFDAQHPFRLLWRTSDRDAPERDGELRDLIDELIARELPIVVHVHHEVGGREVAVARRAVATHLREEGTFTGGALPLPTEDYHGLILDGGMRDARAFCLQAMLLGLPIVARHHIADVAVDGVTAAVARDASTAALVDVVEALLRSRDRRRALIRTAYDASRALLARSEVTAERALEDLASTLR
ncbi:glycosyltransferase [Microbacterium paulum]